jgi:antitoxin MazE
MTAMVQKWGNSLAIRLPKLVADEAKLGQGAAVSVENKGGGILIRPIKKPRKLTLKELVAACKGPNPHGEVDFGSPMGSEVW